MQRVIPHDIPKPVEVFDENGAKTAVTFCRFESFPAQFL
jgi:hypothetical protein